jgi:hypothetical protein
LAESAGTSDPHVALSLNNLAAVYEALTQYPEAEFLFMQSLTILQKTLGPNHPAEIKNLKNLAELYRKSAVR